MFGTKANLGAKFLVPPPWGYVYYILQKFPSVSLGGNVAWVGFKRRKLQKWWMRLHHPGGGVS